MLFDTFSNGRDTEIYDFVSRNGSSSGSLGSRQEDDPSSSLGHISNGRGVSGTPPPPAMNGHSIASNGRTTLMNGENSNSHGKYASDNNSYEESKTVAPTNGKMILPKFSNPYAACNFIVTWDGEDVRAVFEAIKVARSSGDRFIQDKLIEYILNIPFRNPRPNDIPAFVGRPVWAVDRHGLALVGMPGSEMVVTVESLREQIGKGATRP